MAELTVRLHQSKVKQHRVWPPVGAAGVRVSPAQQLSYCRARVSMSRLSTFGEIVPVACEVAWQNCSPRSASRFLPNMSHVAAREEGRRMCVCVRVRRQGGGTCTERPGVVEDVVELCRAICEDGEPHTVGRAFHVIDLSGGWTSRKDGGYRESTRGGNFFDRTSGVARQHHAARRWYGIEPAHTSIAFLVVGPAVARLGVNLQHEVCEQEEHARPAYVA